MESGETLPCMSALELSTRFKRLEQAEDDAEQKTVRVAELIALLSVVPARGPDALNLMQSLLLCLRQAQYQMHQIWTNALRIEAANPSFLTRFLNSTDEELVEVTAAVMATLQNVGSKELDIILGFEMDLRSYELKRLRVEEVGSVNLNVGGQLWPSAVLLARRLWDQQGPYRIDWPNCSVLELGCGVCPLPGITVAQLGAKEVVLSDYLPAILEAAGRSLARNPPHPKSICSLAHVDCASLPSEPEPSRFDCVLASDLVYDVNHAVPLARALKHFLKRDSASRAFVVIGDLAGRRGYEEFLHEIARLGFVMLFEDHTTELNEFVFGYGP